MSVEYVMKRVRSHEDADDDAFKLFLFRDHAAVTCGWFVGTLTVLGGEIDLPYLPASSRTRASVAIIRAIEAAKVAGRDLFVVDPHDLWKTAWAV